MNVVSPGEHSEELEKLKRAGLNQEACMLTSMSVTGAAVSRRDRVHKRVEAALFSNVEYDMDT